MAVIPEPLLGPGPTLAEVLDRLQIAPLSATRRRDLVSAVRRVGAMLDEPLDRIPADAPALRQRLAAIRPAKHAITPKTLQTLRSNLGAAIAETGVVRLARTAKTPLAQEWRDLFAKVKDRRMPAVLSRFARYCSNDGVPPMAVTEETMRAFHDALTANTWMRHPRKVWVNTVWAWNRIAEADVGLGLTPVPPVHREAKSKLLPLDQVPASFRGEFEAYCAWLAGGDPFADGARPRALSAYSVRNRRLEIRMAVTALVNSGVSADAIHSLADLVSAENFRAILRARLAETGLRPNTFNTQIAKGLIILAREWIRAPEGQLAALKQMLARLPKPPPGLTTKNQTLLRQLDDQAALHRFLNAPRVLFGRASKLPPSTRSIARVQAALALAILQDLPLRLANLVDLRFEGSVFLPSDVRGVAQVQIPAEATKTQLPIVAELSSETSKCLRLYRDQLAPAVFGRKPAWVFENLDGSRKSDKTVEVMFTAAVAREVGVHMTPHQCRHLAAKVLLDAQPGAYELVRQLLGHTSTKVTTMAYAGLDTRRAARAHHAVLAEVRAKAEARLPRRRGGYA